MFDSHAHMMDSAFDADREALIAKVFASGVTGWMEVGTSVEESRKAIALAETDDRIIASVGVHPHELKNIHDSDWEEIALLAGHKKVRAIGEVGLDFSRLNPLSPIGEREGVRAAQEQALRRFISLAQQKNLPIIFHVRSGNGIDAHAELIRILRTYSDGVRPRGVIHTFSGTLAQAQEYIALGMMISFSGVITFKNAGELPEAAKAIPIEYMLVETDCPYLTPMPHRGERNDPSFLQFIIKYIADLRGVSFKEIEHATEENAKNLFLST